MSGPEQLVRDFVAASGLLGAGEPELALRCLLPCQAPLERRVPAMVVVGCLLTGIVGGVRYLAPCPVGRRPLSPSTSLTQRLIRAGAELDERSIRVLIAAHCSGEVLIDVLVELLTEFGVRRRAAGRPLVELPLSATAPSGRPVSTDPGGDG